MKEQHFYIIRTFLENHDRLRDTRYYGYKEELVKSFVEDISNDIFQNVWNNIPGWVNDNIDNSNSIEDDRDSYEINFDDDTATYYGSIGYYFDKNQWKMASKNFDASKYEPSYIQTTINLIVDISDIFDSPQVSEIILEFNHTGNAYDYELYPKCDLPKIMKKSVILSVFGNEDEN